jgi:hypothetical protein
MRLRHCVLDVHSGTSLMSIHLRRSLVSARLSLEINPRRARKRVTNLIAGRAHYDTNGRRATDHMSLITKKSEMCCNLAHHRFDCRLGPLCH